MARPRSRAVDFLVYLALRVFVCVGQSVSWSTAIACSRTLAWIVHRFDHRHRKVAEENIRFAFPELDDAGVDSLTRRSYEHLLEMAVEIIRMPRTLHLSNIYDYLHYAQPGQLEQAIAFAQKPRPRLLLTGHFGNWEVISYAVGLVGFRGSVIARKIDNPYIDQFVRDFRRKTGQEILDKSLDYAKMLDVMAQKGGLGMVGDQDAGPRGLFVPFMGRPASTYKSIALMSLEFSAPILIMAAARIGSPLQYRLYVEDQIEPTELANDPDPVRTITRRYAEAMERVVRRHPEQYFWVHRRWKHQPKEAKKKNAA